MVMALGLMCEVANSQLHIIYFNHNIHIVEISCSNRYTKLPMTLVTLFDLNVSQFGQPSKAIVQIHPIVLWISRFIHV